MIPPTKNEIRLIPHINELLREMMVDSDTHAQVRVHRLEQELARLREGRERSSRVLHVSEVSFGTEDSPTCARRLAYKLSSTPISNPPPLDLVNVFEVGHDAHSKYQGMLSWIFRDAFQAEVFVSYEKVPLVGTCDGVLTLPKGDRMYRLGVEFKTCSSSAFKETIPYDKHIDQCIGYAALLGLDAVQLLYENKDNQELAEFTVYPDAERFARIVEICKNIYLRVGEGLLPPRRPSYMECKQCPFHDRCQPTAVRRNSLASL